MCCQRTAIDLWPTASLSNPLGDVKYDACEAILVNPYFLIVGNLPQFAMEGSASAFPVSIRGYRLHKNVPNICKFLRYIANNSTAVERRA